MLDQLYLKIIIFVLACSSSFLAGDNYQPNNFHNYSCENLSAAEKGYLKDFFGELFETDTFGYVLCGQKPLYVGGFKLLADESLGSELESDYNKKMTLGYLALKKVDLKNDQFIFLAKNSFSTCYDDSRIRLTLINKKAFQRIFNNNKASFKKSFGEGCTAKDILDLIVSDGFFRCFRGKVSLQGIALGYGVESSIAYEKSTALVNEFYSSGYADHIPRNGDTQEDFDRLLSEYIDKHHEKWGHLKQLMQDFTNHGIGQNKEPGDVMIPFAYASKSREVKQLIKNYKKYHKKSNRLLNDKQFLKKTLKKLNS